MSETSSDIVCHKSVAYEVILPRPVRNGQEILFDSSIFALTNYSFIHVF